MNTKISSVMFLWNDMIKQHQFECDERDLPRFLETKEQTVKHDNNKNVISITDIADKRKK